MALVLRKAVLPRNVSLLKCIKGRSLATTASKNNPTPLAAGVFRRSLKDAAVLKPLGHMKCKTKEIPLRRGRGASRAHAIRRCISCPELGSAPRPRFVPRHSSLPRTKHTCDANPLSKHPASPFNVLSALSFLNSRAGFAIAKRGFMSNPSCHSPCGPCGPCGPCRPCAPCCAPCCPFRTPPCGSPCNPCGTCLPPPGGNHAPQCLQYMTGYYYYPYGTWFCGPYHVAGKCVPVASTCVPPQCCPAKCCSCCIAPACAAFMPMQGMQDSQDMPSPSQCQVEMPLETPTHATGMPQAADDASKKSRQGLSKFFPFNSSSVAMGAKAAAFPKQDDSISSFDKKFSPKASDASRSSSSQDSPSKFNYYSRLNTPPARKYSRCATDIITPPKTTSPIRHKHTGKHQYVWKVLDRSKPKYQNKAPIKFYRATPLSEFKAFKPYDS